MDKHEGDFISPHHLVIFINILIQPAFKTHQRDAAVKLVGWGKGVARKGIHQRQAFTAGGRDKTRQD